MLARATIIVSGKVQGVLYRDTMREQALMRSLKGCARNLATGEVEATVEGEKEQIDSLIGWARVGPPAAKVSDVNIEWDNYKGEFSGFRIF